MLGHLLEIALGAPDSRESFEFYRRLGFESAVAGDVWSHPYGVVCCEELAIGLHGQISGPRRSPVPVFVRPDIAGLHRALTDQGQEVASAVLGPDAFNQLELTDPGGNRLRVIEARSFSPPPAVPTATLLGRFWRLSLPAPRPERMAGFWQRLGVPTAELEEPWPAVATGSDLPLAWHSQGRFPEAALLFRHRDPGHAADVLEARGFEPEERPLPFGGGLLQLRSPEDVLLLVLA